MTSPHKLRAFLRLMDIQNMKNIKTKLDGTLVHEPSGITVKLDLYSKTVGGANIYTFILKYQRFIHSELLTHRVFSRSSSSSRAIPVDKSIKDLNAAPIHWGMNQKGMQAKKELDGEELEYCKYNWQVAARSALKTAKYLSSGGLHKQVANRIIEPFSFIHTVLTTTELENFFSLRISDAAQPEIRLLAEMMKHAVDVSTPQTLHNGMWHIPLIPHHIRMSESQDLLLKYSVAACARTSYMNHNKEYPSLDSNISLYNMLLDARHMSPFEHQARPPHEFSFNEAFTNVNRNGDYFSGNLRNVIQYRQTLEVD